MTKLLRYDSQISDSLPVVQKAILILGAVVTTILIVILISFLISALFFDGAINRDFCFYRSCIQEALGIFDLPLGVAKVLGAFVVGFTTVASLTVALGVYLANSKSVEQQAKSAALQLHAVRFSSFRAFLSEAVGRGSRLSLDSIDLTSWYFKIFPNTYEGDISISSEYIESVQKISNAMLAADEKLGPASPRFNHHSHQRALIPMFVEIGIKLESLPRLDYFLIEDEVVDLISSVHHVFGIKSVDFGKRMYRGVS